MVLLSDSISVGFRKGKSGPDFSSVKSCSEALNSDGLDTFLYTIRAVYLRPSQITPSKKLSLSEKAVVEMAVSEISPSSCVL